MSSRYFDAESGSQITPDLECPSGCLPADSAIDILIRSERIAQLSEDEKTIAQSAVTILEKLGVVAQSAPVIVYIAGEDICAGMWGALDPVEGKLYRAEQSDSPVCRIYEDCREGERLHVVRGWAHVEGSMEPPVDIIPWERRA